MSFKVLLLYPNIQSEQMPPPSMALFSALLKRAGFEVSLFDTTNYEIDTEYVDSERVKMTNLSVRPFDGRAKRKISDVNVDFRSALESFNPDLIAVTVTENMFPTAISLLSRVSDIGIPTVLGGIFATSAPELALRWKEIDMVCVGEGEHLMVELCRRMSRGEDFSDIPGLWLKEKDGSVKKNMIGRLANMEENPLPDFTIFEDARFYRPMAGKMWRIFPIETHRGCPYTCSFCNSPGQEDLYRTIGQKFLRKKSFSEIRRELLFCRDEWQAEYFFFWADTFFAWSEREFDEFCEMYKDIGIPFWCQTRPETVVEHRMRKLSDVGVHRMGFGIEHGNAQFRKDVVRRAYTNKLVVESMAIPRAFGIQFSVNNIIGFPNETRALVFDTIELNRHVPSDTLSCSIFVPFHGTALRQMAVDLGYIEPDVICPTNSDDTVLSMPSPYLGPEEMKALRRVFTMYVKFPKNRWDEIKRAEELTPEGDELFDKLRDEYIDTFLSDPEGDIEKINATA